MALRDFAESPEFGARAQLWADRLYFGLPGQQGSWPVATAFGIHGVGLVKRHHKEDYIALFAPAKPGAAEAPLDATAWSEPEADDGVVQLIRTVLPDEPFHRVGILRIPPLIRNATAGTVVYGALQGTAGPGVTWGSGQRGFLTAGHVALYTTHVTDGAGANLGKTIHVFDPAAGGGGAPNVDVAVIEVASGVATTSYALGAALNNTTPTSVDLHLTAGHTASTVLGMIGWYVWPGIGPYIDLYMTNAACTVPGDSGAVVTVAGSNDAIGTVVGGTKTFSSFIQNLQTQVTALKTVTGLSALSL